MLPLQLRQFVWSFILLWRMEEVSCRVVSRHIALKQTFTHSLPLRSASYNGDVSEVHYCRKSISGVPNPFCIHPQACYGCYFWDQQDAHTPKCSWGGCTDHNVHFLGDYKKVIMMLLTQLVFFRKLIAAPELSVI